MATSSETRRLTAAERAIKAAKAGQCRNAAVQLRTVRPRGKTDKLTWKLWHAAYDAVYTRCGTKLVGALGSPNRRRKSRRRSR